MNTVYFIRHGETAMAGRFCGHADPELNDRGREQALALRSLQGLHCVYSSDLRRATSTAEAIGVPVVMRPALREIYFGQWEGLSWEEIEREDASYASQWIARFPALPAPGGESFQQFEARVLEEVEWLLGQPRPIAVVTHGGVLRVVLRHWHGCTDAEAWQQTQAYGCMVIFQGEEQ